MPSTFNERYQVARSVPDLNVLSQDERKEYEGRLKGSTTAQTTGLLPRRVPVPLSEEEARRVKRALISSACVLGAIDLGAFIVLAAENGGVKAEWVAPFVVFFAMFGWSPILLVDQVANEAARTRFAKAYLVDIGYAERALARSASGQAVRRDDDEPNSYWMTGSYDPTRYYSYTRAERDYMRNYGMDADTYDSNVGGG